MTDNVKTHSMFIATISFFEQHSGPLRVLAKDEAHVRELLPQLYPQLRDITVLDIVPEKAIKMPDAVEDDTPQQVH